MKKELIPVLARSALFRNIEEREIESILKCLDGRAGRYGDGEAVLREGDRADALGIVLSGGVRISRTDFNGIRSVLAEAGPGEMFAEAFAFSGAGQMSVDVTAAGETEVLMLNAERLAHTCSNACEFHSRLILNLLRVMASKNLTMNRKLQITSRRTTREKLLAYLEMQAKQAGNPSFTIPFDRQGLADFLEVDRSGLSAEIGKLRREGVLTSSKNRFTLLRTQ